MGHRTMLLAGVVALGVAGVSCQPSTQMIGVPEADEQGNRTYPKPTGVIELLEQRGFRTDEPRKPGNIHFEKYW